MELCNNTSCHRKCKIKDLGEWIQMDSGTLNLLRFFFSSCDLNEANISKGLERYALPSSNVLIYYCYKAINLKCVGLRIDDYNL